MVVMLRRFADARLRSALAHVASDMWWGFTHPADRLIRNVVPPRPARTQETQP